MVPLLVAGMISFYAIRLLSLSIVDSYDAYHVWFYQAARVFFQNSIDVRPLGMKALDIYHWDYPKLVIALSAQVMSVAGYWNEFLPKLAFVPVLLAAFIGIFSFFSWRLSFLYLVCFGVLSLGETLWNGYMDGTLVLFAAVPLFFSAGRSADRSRLDWLAASLGMGLLCLIKAEGNLVVVCFAVVAAIIAARSFRAELLARAVALEWRALWFFAPFLPAALWTVEKAHWGLHSYLDVSGSSLGRVSERLHHQGDLGMIFGFMTQRFQCGQAFLIFAAALLYTRFAKVRSKAPGGCAQSQPRFIGWRSFSSIWRLPSSCTGISIRAPTAPS